MPALTFLARIRAFFARVFGRATVPGRFETGSASSWHGWIGVAPLQWPSRDYLLYVPRGYSRWKRRPLVVWIHGCRQTAQTFAAGTRIAALADRKGWLVLLPNQAEHANAWACWNWFDERTAAGLGEAAIIAAQVRAVRRAWRVHPRRVLVAGMSSGGCLAAVLGMRHPRLFTAVAVHSGVACGAASKPAKAMDVLRRGADAPVDAIAARARADAPARALPLPLLAIHGGDDTVVAEVNAFQVVRAYLVFSGRLQAEQGAPDTLPEPDATASRDDAGRRTLIRDFSSDGRLLARYVHVDGLGHAWSGGDGALAYNDPHPPDATELVAEFFEMQWGRERTSMRRRV